MMLSKYPPLLLLLATPLQTPPVIARVASATFTQPAVSQTGPRVTLTVRDSTLVYVVNELARQVHLQPFYKNDAILDKRISVHIVNAPVSNAFAQVLQGTGLVATVTSDGQTVVIREALAREALAKASAGYGSNAMGAIAASDTDPTSEGGDGGSMDQAPAGAWHIRTVHVAPHVIVLDPSHQSATVTFTNTGNVATDADVVLQLEYPYFPKTDTALFSRTWTWKDQEPRDTLIVNPGPEDHYAGGWISGIPTHLRLQANQTIHATLRINPPANLPNGEYYARIMAVVAPPKKNKSMDTKQQFHIPIKGQTLPLSHDSVWVYYRKGPPSMGMTILRAEAQQDTTATAREAFQGNAKVVRFLIQYHLSGTTHFEGRMEVSHHGEVIASGQTGSQYAFPLYRDGTMRWLVGGPFEKGRDSLTVRFFDYQDNFPADKRVPMKPAEVTIPYDIEK